MHVSIYLDTYCMYVCVYIEQDRSDDEKIAENESWGEVKIEQKVRAHLYTEDSRVCAYVSMHCVMYVWGLEVLCSY